MEFHPSSGEVEQNTVDKGKERNSYRHMSFHIMTIAVCSRGLEKCLLHTFLSLI
jgi:hypothetical protein